MRCLTSPGAVHGARWSHCSSGAGYLADREIQHKSGGTPRTVARRLRDRRRAQRWRSGNRHPAIGRMKTASSASPEAVLPFPLLPGASVVVTALVLHLLVCLVLGERRIAALRGAERSGAGAI